jgi:hypothetical protein
MSTWRDTQEVIRRSLCRTLGSRLIKSTIRGGCKSFVPVCRTALRCAALLLKGFRLFQLSSDGRIGREHLAPICRGFAMLIALPPRTTFSFQ